MLHQPQLSHLLASSVAYAALATTFETWWPQLLHMLHVPHQLKPGGFSCCIRCVSCSCCTCCCICCTCHNIWNLVASAAAYAASAEAVALAGFICYISCMCRISWKPVASAAAHAKSAATVTFACCLLPVSDTTVAPSVAFIAPHQDDISSGVKTGVPWGYHILFCILPTMNELDS